MARLITPHEFKKMFGVSLSTQAKWRMQRKIPYLKMGRFVRYDLAVLDEWLRTLTIMPTT